MRGASKHGYAASVTERHRRPGQPVAVAHGPVGHLATITRLKKAAEAVLRRVFIYFHAACVHPIATCSRTQGLLSTGQMGQAMACRCPC